ncbi:2-hydroxy-3-oxopropionate reductase [Tribonema minus]|uniref:2-hydroxy-3-oxopropionate reductase n=1 Tax=Tribonema minus TaxID=303371 RepID=A0A835YH89_9STRA|nr:2-hydroxy-3-oxopropionate reductase [Tribonema minus]
MSATSDTNTFGFIGLGIMGEGMVANLLKGDRNIVVWNRSQEKCQQLKDAHGGRITVASSPREVIESVDVTFSMLSTPEASSAVFNGDSGVLAGVTDGKSIVDCATLTVADMQGMAQQVTANGGDFLEAPVSGSKGPAAAGQLIFLCGGSEPLFERVKGELELMGKASFLLGGVGKGTEMKLVANMIMGTMLASLAEGMSLSESLGLKSEDLIEILGLGAMANPMFKLKGPLMESGSYAPNFPLKHAQKDMRFALGLGEATAQPLPLAAAANAEYLRALPKFGDDDFCAVIEALKSRPN